MRARTAAVLGVITAVLVAGLAIARRKRPVPTQAIDTTTAIRIVRRNALGLPEKNGTVRDPQRVRAMTEALGVDTHHGGPCPPDYAAADLGIVLSGASIYVKRNVYVFALLGDAEPSVVSVTSAGCRVGPPADRATLRRELQTAKILE